MPIEISKNDSDRVVDLLIYDNHHVLIEKKHNFLINHLCNFVCRRGLSSYTSQIVLMMHTLRCERQKMTSIRKSNESHLNWGKQLHKNHSYFRRFADFEADNVIDSSNIRHNTAIVYKQYPVCEGEK